MEDQILQQLIEKYKLSKEDHAIVLELLKNNLFLGKTKEDHPTIVFVIGQPGSVKTTLIQK